MTLRVNPEFATLLRAAATTNIAWSNAFKAALGSSRRVICKRHANASTPQENVYDTGVKFRDAALTGDMTVKGGIVTGYGFTSNLTTALAADLNSGISILRIEGNGNWIEGTLGLVGSNADFVLPANPTATNSIAVSPNLRINPPPFLPSGTGYAPPALDSDAPAYVIVDNYTDPANVVQVKRIDFNKRVKNWTFEDAEYAANVGDVRVMQSTDSVVYGDMEIGFTLLSVDPQVGTVDGKVKHQILGAYMPTASNWPNYPRPNGATGGGYRQGTRNINGLSLAYGISNTFPGPHKIRIFAANDRLLGTIDMPRDGLPINSPELSEVPTTTKPLRPHMHCAAMVFWESHPSKLNSYSKKYFSGIAPEFMRPSQMKQQANANAVYPMYGFQQGDGFGQWYAVSKWCSPANASATAAAAGTLDPYLYTTGNGFSTPVWANWYGAQAGDFGTTTNAIQHIMQYGYEPGSFSCHDLFSGPGGYRVDRAIIPDPIAIHMTDPAWVHLHDGASITAMVAEWNKAYFNHAIHHFTDVKTFAGLPVQEVLDGKWANYQQYYGGSIYTDINHAVAKFVWGAGGTEFPDRPHYGAFTDASYRMPWNGFSVDFLHNYTSPGWAALLYNSPAHAVSQKFRYFEHIQCMALRTRADSTWQEFGLRSHAWILFQESMMWKLASDHPLGVSRAQVERRIEDCLIGLYNNITVPVFVNNDQSMRSRGIRNLGLWVEWQVSYGTSWYARSFTLHYYMAHALVVWRQFGLMKVMMARSEACRQAILTIIKLLDKGAIDYYLDTDGCYSGSVYGASINLWVGDRTIHDESVEIASSWADWLSRVNPKASPQEDLVHNADGTLRGTNNTKGLDIGEWSRLQWPFIRRDYFADIPCDRDVNACCTKINGWLQVYTDRVNALVASNASKRSIAGAEPAVHPALGRLLPPPTLEPI
jgi:hypothetical protein